MEKKIIQYLKDNYDILDDLTRRLQDDYNGEEMFSQCEEDRLVLYNLLEMLDGKDLDLYDAKEKLYRVICGTKHDLKNNSDLTKKELGIVNSALDIVYAKFIGIL